jgi:hypothetical protein
MTQAFPAQRRQFKCGLLRGDGAAPRKLGERRATHAPGKRASAIDA